MKLSQKMHEALSKQMNLEIASAYLYLEMSYGADDELLSGYSHWLETHAGEEMEHAQRFQSYIKERNEQPILYDIERIDFTWESALKTAEAALAHENEISDNILELVELAIKERDFGTLSFLQWFVNEQVEEESRFTELADGFRLAGDNRGALMTYDAHLAQR